MRLLVILVILVFTNTLKRLESALDLVDKIIESAITLEVKRIISDLAIDAFKSIRFDKNEVSLANRLDNIKAVSEIFNFKPIELPDELLKLLILFDSNKESEIVFEIK